MTTQIPLTKGGVQSREELFDILRLKGWYHEMLVAKFEHMHVSSQGESCPGKTQLLEGHVTGINEQMGDTEGTKWIIRIRVVAGAAPLVALQYVDVYCNTRTRTGWIEIPVQFITFGDLSLKTNFGLHGFPGMVLWKTTSTGLHEEAADEEEVAILVDNGGHEYRIGDRLGDVRLQFQQGGSFERISNVTEVLLLD